MLNLAPLFFGVLGAAALVGGLVLAWLATRGAPDGFEDQEGFHSGAKPAAPASESVLPPGDPPTWGA